MTWLAWVTPMIRSTPHLACRPTIRVLSLEPCRVQGSTCVGARRTHLRHALHGPALETDPVGHGHSQVLLVANADGEKAQHLPVLGFVVPRGSDWSLERDQIIPNRLDPGIMEHLWAGPVPVLPPLIDRGQREQLVLRWLYRDVWGCLMGVDPSVIHRLGVLEGSGPELGRMAGLVPSQGPHHSTERDSVGLAKCVGSESLDLLQQLRVKVCWVSTFRDCSSDGVCVLWTALDGRRDGVNHIVLEHQGLVLTLPLSCSRSDERG